MNPKRIYAKPAKNQGLQTRRRHLAADTTNEGPETADLLPPNLEVQVLGDLRFIPSANLSRKAQVLLSLQRTQGNAYVQRLVAQHLQASASARESSLSGYSPYIGQGAEEHAIVQRQEEEEEESVQARRKVGTPVQRQVEEEEEEPVQSKPKSGLRVQRQAEEEDEEALQAKSKYRVPSLGGRQEEQSTEPEDEQELPSIVTEIIRAGNGRPLDDDVRAAMESDFGYDFSRVRIHTDGRAAESAEAISSLAYTAGQDIVFGPGQYAPRTTEGRRLLAHELVHTVQQSSGEVVGSGMTGREPISDPSDSFEREADRVASQVMEMPEPEAGHPDVDHGEKNGAHRGVPDYIQATFGPGRVDLPRYREGLRRFREEHPDDVLSRYRSKLGEGSGRVVISQVSPLKQIRCMGREPEVAVRDLSELDSYLGRGQNIAQVAAETAFANNPTARQRLTQASDAIGRVRGPISRTSEVLEYGQQLANIVSAVQQLEGTDMTRDPAAAARAFDRLFSAIGQLGESIPVLNRIPYFELLSNVGTFFEDMQSLLDPSQRPAYRQLQQELGREGIYLP